MRCQRQERLTVWVGEQGRNPEPKVRLELSAEAQRKLEAAAKEPPVGGGEDLLKHLKPEDRLKLLILQAMFGIRIRVLKGKAAKPLPDDLKAAFASPRQQPTEHRQGWGMIYEAHESYQESERLRVAVQGQIHTADGAEINFEVQLTMARSFATEEWVRIRAGDAKAKDPLVINFDGQAAELTETRFAFDLDADGQTEMIPFLRSGSGYLALDRTGDGKVNDGSELFGPASGNGFAELHPYDSDGNGWLDENDPVFASLRIWTVDADGNDQLYALGQKGIGAIYLGAVAGEFTVKDAGNQALAQNQRVGVFLKEDGKAGTVQQLDIVV